jgi:hypothetical protein
MVPEVDGMGQSFIIEFQGGFDTVVEKIPEITHRNLIGDLGTDIGRGREPDIQRSARGGVAGQLQVLASPGVTGLHRMLLIDDKVQRDPWLQSMIGIKEFPSVISGRIGDLVGFVVIKDRRFSYIVK